MWGKLNLKAIFSNFSSKTTGISSEISNEKQRNVLKFQVKQCLGKLLFHENDKRENRKEEKKKRHKNSENFTPATVLWKMRRKK